MFADEQHVAADRLLGCSVVFNIDGESYRMRLHRARTERLSRRPSVAPRDSGRRHDVA